MSKVQWRSLVVALLCGITFAAVLPVGASAQWGRIKLGRRGPKPEKPPDRREYQAPVNGEFRASPTFFAARGDDERCGAIDLWLSSIRHEATQDRQYGNRLNRSYWKGGELDITEVHPNSMHDFMVPGFRGAFGKGIHELDEKEMKEVAKGLDKCSYQPWVAYLERLFKDPAWMKEAAATFERTEQRYAARKAERERQLYAERYLAETRRTGYALAELLKETDAYRLHAAFLGGRGDWCSREGRAVVAQVFRGDEGLQVADDERYWRRFESEVLPAVKAGCPGAERVYVAHHVEGFYVNLGRFQISRQVDAYHPSEALNIAVYAADADAASRRGWIYGNGSSDLLDRVLNARRRGGGLDYSRAGLTDDKSVTSISGLRAALKMREAEEKARKDREAAEELARKAEERRQAELARQAKIANKRDGHRARAAGVLAYYKAGAPARYNFSGYEQQEALQSIYAGDFEPFTGGFDSEAQGQASVAGSLLTGYFTPDLGASLSKALQAGSDALELSQRRALIKMAYYGYHRVYAEQCASNREMPWSNAGGQWIKKDRWGNIVERNEAVSLPVREPFRSTYATIYERHVGRGDQGNILYTPSIFLSDFRRFLRAEGCASPAARHFETNLYLATEWLLPVQELRPAAGPAGPPPAVIIQPPVAPPSETRQFRVTSSLLTTLEVLPGQKVSVTAGGTVLLGPLAGNSTPEGIRGYESYSHLGSAPHGALLVRIRQRPGDEWMVCGTGCSFTAQGRGLLEFAVNDRNAANNAGAYQIQVKVDTGRPR